MYFSYLSRMASGIFALLLFHHVATAQLAYSPFTEASVAYVALSGPTVNFARGNPAALAWMHKHARFSYNLENNQNHLDSPIQNFALRMAVTPRLTLAVGQWQWTATTGAVAGRSFVDDPLWQHPLRWIGFGYRQKMSAGLGFQITPHLALGIATRQEEYSATPTFKSSLGITREYRTLDFGISLASHWFNGGIVFRNFRWFHLSGDMPPQITGPLNDGSSFTWNPAAFTGIAFAPQSAVEAGVQGVVNSHLQILGDLSSRKEYALGLKLQILPMFSLSAGQGERFDRIYKEVAMRYAALGAQLQLERFALAVTWIAPRRAGHYRFVETADGQFEVRQQTNHQLLMGMAFFL